ncbi:hypothetical protein [Dyella sp. C9]|uniref:hypothetical protein n=1 Tax=Dyella sp. C9 TaxID=2202154 RepID=UPI0018E51A3A|nr:hypothetical protein [Dyella sp. C9]
MSLLSLLSIWLSEIPLAASALLCLAVAVAGLRAVGRFEHGRIVAAGMASDGSWSLRLRDGQDVPARLSGFRVLPGRHVWLGLRAPGLGWQPLLLAPDNSDEDTRRRLRMRLAVSQPDQDAADGTLSAERGPTVWPRLRR